MTSEIIDCSKLDLESYDKFLKAKLNILKLYKKGWTQEKIAKKYKVTQVTISYHILKSRYV